MRLRAFAVCFFLALLMAWPAAAQQQRTPAAGNFAIGGDVGLFVARPGFDNAISLDGLAEYYIFSRLSVRGLFGWENPGVNNTGCATLPTRCNGEVYDHLRLEFSGVYNWEGEAWHPFVLAGVGAVFLKDAISGEFPRRPKFSAHLGVGVEYFARPDVTVKGEVTYHAMRHGDLGPDPSGLTITAGLKKYF